MKDRIIIQTKDGQKETDKLEIVRALLSFDSREPDKTMSLWQELAKKLYQDDELRVFERFQGVRQRP